MNRLQYPSALLAALFLSACSQDGQDAGDQEIEIFGPGQVAVVNGNRIPSSVFRLFTLNTLQSDSDQLPDEVRAEALDRLILIRLLADEAEKSGLDRETDTATELELLRMQILARAMTERFADENQPSASELRELYQENLSRLSNTQFKTRHILVETEDEALLIIGLLNDGADFADLAREHSTGPTGPDGGDLGWITVQSVVEPFGDAIQMASPGEHLPTPVQTQYGWHLILVEEVEADVAPGIDAVRQDLVVAAEAIKLEAYLDDLREIAEVTITE